MGVVSDGGELIGQGGKDLAGGGEKLLEQGMNREDYVFDHLDELVPNHGEKAMSDFLYYIISVDSSIEKEYWWPLIFEAAYRSSFSFQQFGASKREGVYFSKNQVEDIESSFSDLWNVIYNDLDSVLVSLWFRDTSFFVQASLEESTEKKVQIYLTMENSLLYQKSKEEMYQFVAAFLRYSLELYNLCHPENGELFWDDVRPSKMPLMQVVKKGEDIRLDPVLLSGQTLSWKQIPVSSNNKIFLLNPFPVWSFRQWNFFPVVDLVSLPKGQDYTVESA